MDYFDHLKTDRTIPPPPLPDTTCRNDGPGMAGLRSTIPNISNFHRWNSFYILGSLGLIFVRVFRCYLPTQREENISKLLQRISFCLIESQPPTLNISAAGSWCIESQ